MIMKKNLFINTLAICILLTFKVIAAQSNFFDDGVKLYKKGQIEKSKILFERDIVFNPKSEKSYLYLAKIYKKKENEKEEEVNLNNVLLINPKNDEAIYMLALLKIKQSDYEHVNELIDRFILVCKSYCSKEKEIRDKFKKLTPENAKNKN